LFSSKSKDNNCENRYAIENYTFSFDIVQVTQSSKRTIVFKETKRTQAEPNKKNATTIKMDILEHLGPIFQFMASAFVSLSHHTMLVCCLLPQLCLLLLFGWSESLHCCGAEEIEKDASDPVLQVFQ
jgi:hypothetical protein